MKSYAAILFVLVGTALALGQASPQFPGPPIPAVPGRYQLATAAGPNSTEVWLIDTQTGDTWRRTLGAARWVYTGNPTQDPGPRAPASRPATQPQTRPQAVLPER
jgi:hypothetical protein